MTELIGRARVLADAAARGLDIEVVERPAADSLEHAAELLGLAPRDIVKSLVVRHHTPEGAPAEYLFALIPGDRQVSWAKLRAVVGANRLSLPSPDLALEATGYERGTITPLGSAVAWPVFADASMVGGRVAMGAGEHGYSAFIDADALIAAYGVTVADITVADAV
jgi:Cys-tRNA(Pro)/Cys-tRNA(Cys) deacylase